MPTMQLPEKLASALETDGRLANALPHWRAAAARVRQYLLQVPGLSHPDLLLALEAWAQTFATTAYDPIQSVPSFSPPILDSLSAAAVTELLTSYL